MARRNDNGYTDWDTDKLLKTDEKLKDDIYKALKGKKEVNPEDLWELLEMERELTLREGQ